MGHVQFANASVVLFARKGEVNNYISFCIHSMINSNTWILHIQGIRGQEETLPIQEERECSPEKD